MIRSLFKILSFLPLFPLHALGAALGALVYLFSSKLRHHAAQQIRLCYPNEPEAVRKLAFKSFLHSGMAVLELPFVWGNNRLDRILGVSKVENEELIAQALKKGRGVIFLTPHMGSFEAVAQWFTVHGGLTVLYRPNKNAAVQALIEANRGQQGVHLAPTNLAGLKQMIKALRSGECVGLLPDQVPGKAEGVWADMFGQPAYTMTLPWALQSRTQSPIILALAVRRPLRGFTFKLFETPEVMSKDPQMAAEQTNRWMEDLIRMHPEQYYWSYDRFKAPKETRRIIGAESAEAQK